jgi:hypothetical protein
VSSSLFLRAGISLRFCLFSSGQVCKGQWDKTDVALKVLRLNSEIVPSAEVRSGHPQASNLH